MPNNLEVTVRQVAAALSAEPQKPAALCARLNCSRATIHRRLAALVKEGLAVRVGSGPAAAYRQPLPVDALKPSIPFGPVVQLTMSLQLAALCADALELHARVGIAQLECIAELGPWWSLTLHNGSKLDSARMDSMRHRLLLAKSEATGYPPNASHGIYHPAVDRRAVTAFALYKAIRHRISWDKTPQGGLGVHHDEPLAGSAADEFVVFSENRKDAPGDGPQADQRAYVIEASARQVALLVESLQLFADCLSGRYELLAQWIVEGRIAAAEDGKRGPQQLAAAAQELARLRASFEGPLQHPAIDTSTALAEGLAAALEKAKPCEIRTEAGAARVAYDAVSPTAALLRQLPPNTLVTQSGRNYRVAQPCADGTFVVLGESHSLQTAIQMAHNRIAGKPARAWAL